LVHCLILASLGAIPLLSQAASQPRILAQLSHLEGFAGAKPFRISEGYPKVFTTGKGVGDLF
jgi:hypothetical protein